MATKDGALAAMRAGGPADEEAGSSEPGVDDSYSEDSAAFDAFANATGIAPEKRAGAQAALKQYVMACVRSGDTSTGE